MCKNLYERCFIDQTGTECCKGLICNTEGAKVGVCLKEEFSTCRYSRACGYGLSCEAGFCVQGQNQCKKMDQTCEKFTDCCPDMLCDKNHKCMPCEECRTIGETCLFDAHCKFWFGTCNMEVCTECPDIKRKTRCLKQNYLCKKDEHCRPGLRCLFDENEGDYFCSTPQCEFCEEKEGPVPPDIEFPAEDYMKQIWLDPDAPDKIAPKKKKADDTDDNGAGSGSGSQNPNPDPNQKPQQDPNQDPNNNSQQDPNKKPHLSKNKQTKNKITLATKKSESLSSILKNNLQDYKTQLSKIQDLPPSS